MGSVVLGVVLFSDSDGWVIFILERLEVGDESSGSIELLGELFVEVKPSPVASGTLSSLMVSVDFSSR